MPLNKTNTRTFHRTLYGSILESVTVLKRGNDQQQGTVTSYRMHECRWSRTFKSGEPLQIDWASSHRRTLHIPVIEMERLGISYFNVLDRFIDESDRYWQPESNQTLTIKLIENHWCVECIRADPPRSGA